MSKIKILVIPSDKQGGGVGFYRSFQPHEYLKNEFPEDFEVDYDMNPAWDNYEHFKKYDIVQVHKGVFKDRPAFIKTLKKLKLDGIVTVMDIDDSWDLSPTHPLYETQKQLGIGNMIKENFPLFDYVTTTTDIFAEDIKEFNSNVKVLPNAIDPTDERFIIDRKPSERVRVGFIMGSAHEYDVEQMGNFVSKIDDETLAKMQVVLCGFDIRGVSRSFDPRTGQIKDRPITPIETCWYRYEGMVTNNRKIIDRKYRRFLNMFLPYLEYPNVEKEMYRRCWTKDINNYYKHYENVDILLAPLEVKHFNKVKSPLKEIECCFSSTALIAQNYGPYTIDLINAFNEDGTFNEKGTAILIDGVDNPEDWAKAITYLVSNPDKLEILQKNIHEAYKDKYSLQAVGKERAEFYKEIAGKAERGTAG